MAKQNTRKGNNGAKKGNNNDRSGKSNKSGKSENFKKGTGSGNRPTKKG